LKDAIIYYLNFLEQNRQIFDEFFLFPAFAEELGHVGSKLTDDVGVDLGHPRAFNEVVQLAQGCVLWQVLKHLTQIRYSLDQWVSIFCSWKDT
jgi:hypothetical protein